MTESHIQFEWDEAKAVANDAKHGVTFETASTVFGDPELLVIANLEHSESEERWFSTGWASNGAILSIAYVLSQVDPNTVKIRLISARRATQAEIRRYAVK